MKAPRFQLWFLVLVSLLSGPPAVLAQRRPIFIESAVPGEPDRADEAVTRSRFVRVSARNLLEGAEASILDLNLFPDRALRARIERIDVLRDHTVYFGRLEGRDEGEALLVVQDGVVAGTIRGGGKLFQIRFAGGGVHEVQEIDPLLLPSEDEPLEPAVELDAAEAVEAVADDGSLIDVFVAYTPAARAGAGGTTAMEALVNLAIAETNQAYLNSGAIQRVRLAGTAELAYTESGDMSNDLNRLRQASDGHLDQVHALRDGSSADLVHLIVESGGSCGVGYVMSFVSSSFASYAFAVTKRSCVSPNLTFAHEIGHNMGLQHDRYVNQSNSPFSYSHGYVNQAAFAPGAATNKRWRTVMAYNDECAAAGFACTRLMYFSDPARTYTGDPMGVPGTASSSSPDGPANERLSLDATRTTVANFRVGAVSPPPPPATPTTLSPSGDISDTTPTFQWAPVAGAASYQLWVKRSAVDVYTLTYSSTAAGCATGPVCSATPAPVLALAAHTFQVRATNSGGSSPWSAARAFNVLLSGFDSQFNGSMAPWQVHSGTWSIVSSQQLYSPGVAGKFVSVSHPTSFTNVDTRVRFSRTGNTLANSSYIFIRGNPTLLSNGRWSQSYEFHISQNGLFAVMRSAYILKGWTASSAINKGSAWNELRVVAIGPSLSFYINGILVWSGTDATFASGRVGIGMYQGPTSTGNGIYVDYATLTVPGTSSSTTTSVASTTTTSVPTTTTSVASTTTTSVPSSTTTTSVASSTTTSAASTTTSTGAAVLQISKTGPNSVSVGATFNYVVTITNVGGATATGVVMEDPLPAGVSYLFINNTNCRGMFGVISCFNLTIPVGAPVTIQIRVTAPLVPGTIRNTASITVGPNLPSASVNTTVTTNLLDEVAEPLATRTFLDVEAVRRRTEWEAARSGLRVRAHPRP